MKQDWTKDNHLIEVLNEKRDVISTAMLGFARDYIVSNDPFVYESTNAIKGLVRSIYRSKKHHALPNINFKQ